MKKCPVCGRSNTDDSKFCESCGNQLGDDRNIFNVYKTLKNDAVNILLDSQDKDNGGGRKEAEKNNSQNTVTGNKSIVYSMGMFLGLFVVVGLIVLAFGYAREMSKVKQITDRLANRSAYERNAIIRCKICGGDGNDCTNCYKGRCPTCEGRGQVSEILGYKNGRPVSNTVGCRVCHLTGICAVCQNNGSCSDCRSTGIELKYSGTDYCQTCKGTGLCLKCEGKGCSSCDNGYCGSCNRTGQAQ